MKLNPGYKTCIGCAEPIIVSQVLDSIENPIIVSLATGCLEVASTKPSDKIWPVPVIHSTFGNSAATISGVESAIKVLQKKGQLKKDVKLLVIAGDGGTLDIGLQALSGALERNHDFVFLCMDNGAYMNTGGQRSSASPYKVKTSTTPSGKITFRKDIIEIVKAHNIPYIAQASLADLDDLKRKAKKAFESKGPAFINVMSPCIRFWKFDMIHLRKVSDLSLNTCFWPLYEIENGIYNITRKPDKKIPIKDFLEIQKRFSDLTSEDILEIQKYVDKKWDYLVSMSDNN